MLLVCCQIMNVLCLFACVLLSCCALSSQGHRTPLCYAALIIDALNKTNGAFFLSSARQSLTHKSIVGVLVFATEKATCLQCLSHNGQFPLCPLSL